MYPSDMEIAREAKLLPITAIAKECGIAEEDLMPYGRYKAKVDIALLERLKEKEDGHLILVSAMSPTPLGEGKSTLTIGLSQALCQLGEKAIAALREPSMGPNFGLKGGAAGGGYAQVMPMDEINLHFTGDFHAITAAHNLLAAAIDNHLYHGNALCIDPDRIVWRRVLDMNDRALRDVVIGLGGKTNGVTRQTGFDITVASEIMAIVCLVESLDELKTALADILIGYTYDQQPIFAKDLHVHGAMAAILKDAIHPNLVQTLENTPALVHGGPFANIAHGCNSLLATKMALKLGDYVITEAGFGADLGAEKFFDIKCRKGGLMPSLVVLVATIRALKYHGGIAKEHLQEPNLSAIEVGFANLSHHLSIIAKFHVPVVVAINHFASDTDEEIAYLIELCQQVGVEAVVSHVWEKGGEGGRALAKVVVGRLKKPSLTDAPHFQPLYDVATPLVERIETLCREIYHAKDVVFTDEAKKQLMRIERHGWGNYPLCMAKTSYSFSDDAKKIGDVRDFTMTIREIRPSLGAGFIVLIAGDIMTMPGLPTHPNAERVTLDENGQIEGLF